MLARVHELGLVWLETWPTCLEKNVAWILPEKLNNSACPGLPGLYAFGSCLEAADVPEHNLVHKDLHIHHHHGKEIIKYC